MRAGCAAAGVGSARGVGTGRRGGSGARLGSGLDTLDGVAAGAAAPGQASACSGPPKEQDPGTQHSAPVRTLSGFAAAGGALSITGFRLVHRAGGRCRRSGIRHGRGRHVPVLPHSQVRTPRGRGDTAGREQHGKNPGIHQPTPEARLESKACTPGIGSRRAEIQPKTALCWNPRVGAIRRGQSLSSGQDRQQPDSRKLPKIHSPPRAPPLHYSNQAQGRRLRTGQHPREVANAPLANRLCRRGGVGAPQG